MQDVDLSVQLNHNIAFSEKRKAKNRNSFLGEI